jgi:hypothetical protein
MFLTEGRKIVTFGAWLAKGALVAVVMILVFGLASKVGIDLPNPFDNGRDGDVQAHGTIDVEQQTPKTATDKFAVRIGDGTALVSIRAHQNWDKPGNFSDGDFQPTNGTASVRDPEHNDQPAMIEVGVQYCATGTLMRTSKVDDFGNTVDPASDKVTFDMGSLYVCDVKWLPTEKNEAAFHQDDTPSDFQGAFQERIKGATLGAIEAAECPKKLDWYSTPEYLEFATGALAKQLGIPVENVTVHPGQKGATSRSDQDALRAGLDRFVNTDELKIAYFSGGGEAIEDSCYLDLGAVPLESLAKNPAVGDAAGL